MSKINVFGIVRDHFDTLRDSRGDWHWPDFLLFVGLPISLSIIGVWLHWSLYVDALNAMLAAFSIFAGLLLNLLILVYTFSPSQGPFTTGVAKVRGLFIRHLHSNLAFAVLVSVVIVVLALVSVSTMRMHDTTASAHTGPIMTFVLILLTSNFVLTLLMVLKRINVILSLEADQPAARKAS